jgi:hypothetical protein
MHSCDSEQSSDDSGACDDPHQSSAVPNSLLQLQGDYASDSDDFVPGTPEKEFEEDDWQSDGSDFHTPAQQSKRWRFPSVSPDENRQVDVPNSDSDGVDRDSLFYPPFLAFFAEPPAAGMAATIGIARWSLGDLGGHLRSK